MTFHQCLIAIYFVVYLLCGYGCVLAFNQDWAGVEWDSNPTLLEKALVITCWPFILIEIALRVSEED